MSGKARLHFWPGITVLWAAFEGAMTRAEIGAGPDWEELLNIDGVGEVLAASVVTTFHQGADAPSIDRLVAELDIQDAVRRGAVDSPVVGQDGGLYRNARKDEPRRGQGAGRIAWREWRDRSAPRPIWSSPGPGRIKGERGRKTRASRMIDEDGGLPLIRHTVSRPTACSRSSPSSKRWRALARKPRKVPEGMAMTARDLIFICCPTAAMTEPALYRAPMFGPRHGDRLRSRSAAFSGPQQGRAYPCERCSDTSRLGSRLLSRPRATGCKSNAHRARPSGVRQD